MRHAVHAQRLQIEPGQLDGMKTESVHDSRIQLGLLPTLQNLPLRR
jgi:hypothetical protein